MSLANLLSAEQIIPEMKATERWPAIVELIDLLVGLGKIKSPDRDSILASLKQREETMSTGIGFGIAIPHCSSDRIEEVVAAFGRSSTGIEFDALDNAPVKFVVLFIVPKNQFQTHLRTLASIAKFLNDRTRSRKPRRSEIGRRNFVDLPRALVKPATLQVARASCKLAPGSDGNFPSHSRTNQVRERAGQRPDSLRRRLKSRRRPIRVSAITRPMPRWFWPNNAAKIRGALPGKSSPISTSSEMVRDTVGRRPRVHQFHAAPGSSRAKDRRASEGRAARRSPDGIAKTDRDRFRFAQRRQADARRAHPQHRSRRCARPDRDVSRPRCHSRQSHRRLGHAVRDGDLRLEKFARSRRARARSDRGAGPDLQGDERTRDRTIRRCAKPAGRSW